MFFTGSFILFGALKGNNKWGFISFAIYVFCGVFFLFVTPPYIMYAENFVSNNIEMFDSVSAYLADLLSFNGYVDGHAMLGFLSFAYTYHYLNWFSKVNIIKWNDMPRKRLSVIIILYLMSISIYLYDYALGLTVLLLLGQLHVILEFPLNAFTFISLSKSLNPTRLIRNTVDN